MINIDANLSDGYVVGHTMWAFDNMIQAICCIDLTDGKMEVIKVYESDSPYMVRWMIAYENMLYMCSDIKTDILVFDLEKNCFEKKSYVEKNILITQKNSRVFLLGNVIWMMPVWLEDSIICFNLENQEFSSFTTLLQTMQKVDVNAETFSPFFCVDERFLWVPVFGTNSYIKYNIRKNKSEVHEVKGEGVKLNGIWQWDGKLWFSMVNSKNVLCINKEHHLREYEFGGDGNRYYSSFAQFKEKLYLLPRFSDKMIAFDLASDETEIYDMGYKKNLNGIYEENTKNTGVYQDGLIIYPYLSNVLKIFYPSTGQIETIKLYTECDYELMKVKHRTARGEILRESFDIGLEHLFAICRHVKK